MGRTRKKVKEEILQGRSTVRIAFPILHYPYQTRAKTPIAIVTAPPRSALSGARAVILGLAAEELEEEPEEEVVELPIFLAVYWTLLSWAAASKTEPLPYCGCAWMKEGGRSGRVSVCKKQRAQTAECTSSSASAKTHVVKVDKDEIGVGSMLTCASVCAADYAIQSIGPIQRRLVRDGERLSQQVDLRIQIMVREVHQIGRLASRIDPIHAAVKWRADLIVGRFPNILEFRQDVGHRSRIGTVVHEGDHRRTVVD